MAYYEQRDTRTGKAKDHQINALKASGHGVSNAEVKPSEDDTRYEEFKDDYNLEKEDVKLIEEQAESKISEIETRDRGDGYEVNEYTFENGDEWLVFDNVDDAENVAISQVEEDVDENPDMFTPEMLMDHVDRERAERRFREIYYEQNRGYVDDIEYEDKDEYTNRLANELYERNIITYEEATDEDFDLENGKETMAEQMTDEAINEGKHGFEYYKDNFGAEAANELLKDWDIVDSRSLAEYIVRSDGIGATLSGYDGNQIDLDNRMAMYRIG